MSIHKKIYESLHLSTEEACEFIGDNDTYGVEIRRERLRLFLEGHEWNEDKYKKWLKGGHYDHPNLSKGLGDTIAKITSSVGIRPCGGCKKRQEKLNKLFPYKDA